MILLRLATTISMIELVRLFSKSLIPSMLRTFNLIPEGSQVHHHLGCEVVNHVESRRVQQFIVSLLVEFDH